MTITVRCSIDIDINREMGREAALKTIHTQLDYAIEKYAPRAIVGGRDGLYKQAQGIIQANIFNYKYDKAFEFEISWMTVQYAGIYYRVGNPVPIFESYEFYKDRGIGIMSKDEPENYTYYLKNIAEYIRNKSEFSLISPDILKNKKPLV